MAIVLEVQACIFQAEWKRGAGRSWRLHPLGEQVLGSPGPQGDLGIWEWYQPHPGKSREVSSPPKKGGHQGGQARPRPDSAVLGGCWGQREGLGGGLC